PVLGGVREERVHPVPACRATDRSAVWPVAGDDDGDPRALDRAWQEGHRSQLVVGSREAELLSAPQAVQDRQALVEPGGEHLQLGRLTEGAELDVERLTEADAEHQPA